MSDVVKGLQQSHYIFMAKQYIDDDDEEQLKPEQPTPVVDLPWYQVLRTYLEPYIPASDEKDATHLKTSAEIIQAIESHHGIPQGVIGKNIQVLVMWDDFIRAMEYCGFRYINASGDQLEWMMKKKS